MCYQLFLKKRISVNLQPPFQFWFYADVLCICYDNIEIKYVLKLIWRAYTSAFPTQGMDIDEEPTSVLSPPLPSSIPPGLYGLNENFTESKTVGMALKSE